MSRKRRKTKVVEKSLSRQGVLGFAYIGENLIEIEKHLKGKKRLKVLVHEAIHQAFPNATETEVLNAEKIVGNILWDQNYRKVDNKNF